MALHGIGGASAFALFARFENSSINGRFILTPLLLVANGDRHCSLARIARENVIIESVAEGDKYLNPKRIAHHIQSRILSAERETHP